MGPNSNGDWWARDSAGAQVSSCPKTANTNLTEFVRPDAKGDRYPQWLAKRNKTFLFDTAPRMDIWYSDNAFHRPRTNPGWNGDGKNDSKDDPVVRAYFRRGMAAYWTKAKELLPGILVMGNVDGRGAAPDATDGYLENVEYRGKLPAAFLENAMGKRYSEETWGGWSTMMGSYRKLMDNTTAPHLQHFYLGL